MIDDIYDIETYPNFFSLSTVRESDGRCFVFEISDRVNHSDQLTAYLNEMRYSQHARQCGFNNIGFDYPVIHEMMNRGMSYQVAYEKAMAIINANDQQRFQHMVWDDQRFIPQLDLYKVHHFDNRARSTSLKVLEYNMRSDTIEDLPFPPGTWLTPDQMAIVANYNIHDIMETWKFKLASQSQIVFREELSAKYGRNFLNHNDTKIGKDYFIMELEKAGIECYTQKPRKPIQTIRPQINLGEAVFPWIQFSNPDFQRITDWFRSQTITETKGVFDNVSCTVDGFTYDFGLGGIHGSVEHRFTYSDENYVIVDVDVASYYPNLAIANRLFPHHLSEKFCDIYEDVYNMRKATDKGSTENAMLKLALNGVYGDSNNRYSPFYDPLYTMSITINGQLLLCKLAEMLSEIPEHQMIQINTDGLTIRIVRDYKPLLDQICSRWEAMTKLTLESAEYSRMWVRDVNNYMAEYADGGKLKRIGAYAYERVQENHGTRELGWHKKHSALVVAKAVEACHVHGIPVADFITTHYDLWDFMICAKIPRSSKLLWGRTEDEEIQLQNVTRYYISPHGKPLTKLMPPLAKNPEKWRRIGINVGWKAWVCNDIKDATAPIDYAWYIAEAEKLVINP